MSAENLALPVYKEFFLRGITFQGISFQGKFFPRNFFPRNLKIIIFLHFQSHFLVEDFPSTKFQKPLCSYSGVRYSFSKVLKKHFLSLRVWFSFSKILKKNFPSLEVWLSFSKTFKKNFPSLEVWFSFPRYQRRAFYISKFGCFFQCIEKAHSFFFSSLEKENHTSRDRKCFFNTLEKEYLTPL